MQTRAPLVEMTALTKPGAFLQALLLPLDCEKRRQLFDNLATVERDAKCIHRAVVLMVVLLLLSVAGLGYCALLLPEVFYDPTHLLMRSLSVLLLGSFISQAVCLGYLLWHRTVVTRLHVECRRVILALARSQFEASGISSLAIGIPAPSPLGTGEDNPSTPEARHPQGLARHAGATP
jgi:hypothetical protein